MPLRALDITGLRKEYAGLAPLAGLAPEPGVMVHATALADRPARLYQPPRVAEGSLLYFHGGGFIMGGLDSHDRLLRRVCARAELPILAVDYRLAPEHPYPAAHDDALAALREALTVLPAPLAVGGDSAGANLAASACLQQPGAVLQCLLYPIVDAVANEAERYPSAACYGRGFLLDMEDLHACAALLSPGGDLDGVDWDGPRLSPMRHDLRDMPPALITAAGFDPLRDQAYAYAAALRRAGVRASVWLEPGLIHGFADFAGAVPEARRAVDRFTTRLRTALDAETSKIYSG
ncbi:MAG: alpha/beta hydrolase [Acetobacteraceae bacterium]|nr:alpha/beta hydrolase [Acetobacteraceae bacterium]